jgi:hypothetical protein
VAVQVPAHALVVDKTMAIAEVETLGDAVHWLLVIDYWLFEERGQKKNVARGRGLENQAALRFNTA